MSGPPVVQSNFVVRETGAGVRTPVGSFEAEAARGGPAYLATVRRSSEPVKAPAAQSSPAVPAADPEEEAEQDRQAELDAANARLEALFAEWKAKKVPRVPRCFRAIAKAKL